MKMTAEQLNALLTGCTVASAEYTDPWGKGLTIKFTNGIELVVTERMQAGAIVVKMTTIGTLEVVSKWTGED